MLNAKLSLDSLEIKWRLPSCLTQEPDLWEDSDALRVIQEKIANITENVSNPQ